jgi:hypothetical protein
MYNTQITVFLDLEHGLAFQKLELEMFQKMYLFVSSGEGEILNLFGA